MRAEIEQIPSVLERLLDDKDGEIRAAAEEIRVLSPRLITTIARGSSDHAATYLKYAIELACHIPVASLGPSVSSIYGVTPDLRGNVCLAISQSGESPDIVTMAKSGPSGRREDHSPDEQFEVVTGAVLRTQSRHESWARKIHRCNQIFLLRRSHPASCCSAIGVKMLNCSPRWGSSRTWR